jgi:hypothetical protein
MSDNYGLVWTAGILLRIRRLGVRVLPSAPRSEPSWLSGRALTVARLLPTAALQARESCQSRWRRPRGPNQAIGGECWCLSLFIFGVDSTIVNAALASIQHDLHAPGVRPPMDGGRLHGQAALSAQPSKIVVPLMCH